MADGSEVKVLATKVQKRFKQAWRDLKSLHGSAGDTLKAAESLQTALRSTKPPPKPNAKVTELVSKAGKQQELTRFQQIARQYNSRREDTSNPLTVVGQRKWMLNNLIKMSENQLKQHTGDKAGEAYNQRGAAEVTRALKGLRTNQKKLQTAGKKTLSRTAPSLDVSADTLVSSLDEMVTSLKVEGKQLNVAQVAFKKNFGSIQEQLDELVEALSSQAT